MVNDMSFILLIFKNRRLFLAGETFPLDREKPIKQPFSLSGVNRGETGLDGQ